MVTSVSTRQGFTVITAFFAFREEGMDEGKVGETGKTALFQLETFSVCGHESVCVETVSRNLA